MRMLITGPPGAGKGTQASALADRLGITAISTGDIFRANVAHMTALGRIAREYMDAGEYVPDSVTNAMVRDRLAEPDCVNGFLLDGYPRTLEQVSKLDRILGGLGAGLDLVLELVADTDTLVERLLLRAELEGRADDTADVIRHRQSVYQAQTAPLMAHYEARGLLRQVDGLGPVAEVEARIAATLEKSLA